MKIDKTKIAAEIAAMTKKAGNNECVEIIFRLDKDNQEVEFSGHVWGAFCEYSEMDLCRNGDFKIAKGPYAEYRVVGSDAKLTPSEMHTLWELQHRI